MGTKVENKSDRVWPT